MRMDVVKCIQWVRNVLHGAEMSYTRVKHRKDESKTYGAKGPDLWCRNVL